MNYRHAFHAGNFADLVKHALLLWMLDERLENAAPLMVIDTHAGAGLYDLSETAARSSEARAGIGRLMRESDAPAPLGTLTEAVRSRNVGDVRWYPGSPVLLAERLRPDDRYIGCELRAEEHDRLAANLAGFPRAEARLADGYSAIRGVRAAVRPLVLIDPPFEKDDDYARCAAAAAEAMAAGADAIVAIWTPLKDLETFDGFLRRLEAVGGLGDALIAEVRLRRLTQPLRMNGCALVVIGAPPGFGAVATEVCGWIASELGDPGGLGRVTRLGDR